MGATNPSIPHRREVASLFDDYAPLFDHHLVETLGYVGHEMLADAACNVRKRYSCAVDLGCGTGLAAPALRGACERLVGVDLSVEMILEASQRGGYDELWVADLWYTLTTLETGESDLLFAADVFGYVGPLDGVFDEAQRILPTGGRLAFTVEAHLGPEPFVVQASRRVAYRADYIAGLARQAGFIAETFGEATLRREAGDGVPALLSVWLRQE